MSESLAVDPAGLAGRERELAVLLDSLSQAIVGQGNTIFLVGDAGIGKTRLAKQLLATAENGGCQCFSGSAYTAETSFPYAVVSDALQPFLRSAPPSTLSKLLRQDSRLARIFPFLSGRLAGNASEVMLNAGQEKALLLEAFYEFLQRLAVHRTVILFLDDLQWADSSSLELVHYVARNLQRDRLLLVGAYRSEDLLLNLPLKNIVASLARHGELSQITLPPLSREESKQLVKMHTASENEPAGDLVDFVQDVSRGNPLYLREVLATLIQSGQVKLEAGRCEYEPTGDIPIPHSIRDIVLTRLDRVEPEDRTLLEVACVLGTTFTHPVLNAVARLSQDSLLQALDRLRRLQIIREKVEADADTVVYDFAHPLIRETLYQQLGIERRRVLHTTAARILEAVYAGREAEHVAELAYHYSQASGEDNRTKALHYLIAAGDQSLAVYANREALRHFQAVLGRLSVVGGTSINRAEVKTKIGECHYRLGESDAAIEAWKEAVTLCGPESQPTAGADLHRRIAIAFGQKGKGAEALEHYGFGLDLLSDDRFALERANLHQEMARALLSMGRVSEALNQTDRAVALAENANAQELLGEAYQVLGNIHGLRGGTGIAQSYLANALEYAGRRPRAAWRTHRTLGELAILIGDLRSAEDHLNSCLEIAQRTGTSSFQSWPLSMLAYIRWLRGQWNEGVDLGEKAIGLDRRLGQLAYLPFSLAYTTFLHCSRGDTERALRYAEESLQAATASGRGPAGAVILAHTAIAYTHLSRGDAHRAREHSLRGLEYVDRSGFILYALHRTSALYAEACLALNRLDEAESHINSTLALASRLGNKPAMAGMHKARGLLYGIRGEAAAAEEFARSVQGWEDLGHHFEAARTRFELALAYQWLGQPEAATAELLNLLRTFSEWGAVEDVARTRKALTWLGRKPPRRRHAERLGIPHGLTEREMEIIRLVVQHKSTEEIAQELVIRDSTINTHLANIFRKLDVNSRTQLVSYAHEEGLA